jgi:hypothetical protein
MAIATNPFPDLLWTTLVSCLLLTWLALLFRVIADIVRRRDLSSWDKAAWIVATVLLPFVGVFVYVASERHGMNARRTARSAAKDVEKAEFLRDIGAITQVEFEAVKQTTPNTGLA